MRTVDTPRSDGFTPGARIGRSILWALVGLSLIYYVWIMADLILNPFAAGSNSEVGTPYLFRWLSALVGTAGLTVSLLVVRRTPGNIIGLLMVVYCVGSAGWSIRTQWPTLEAANWVQGIYGVYFLVLCVPTIFLLLFIFPDGQMRPRSFAWLFWGLIGLSWLAAITVLLSDPGANINKPNPLYVLPQLRPFLNILTGIVFIPPLMAAFIAQFLRYRAADARARAQTKWMLWFVGLAVVMTVVSSLLSPEAIGLVPYKTISVVIFLFWQGFPALAIGIAILRHGLWDIDFIINRSLAYGALTLVLGGLFFGLFWALQQAFARVLGGEQTVIAVAASTLTLAVIFNPVRKFLIRQIDQRLYGIRLDYVEAVKAYGGTKRESVKTGDTKTTFGDYKNLTLLGRGGMGEVYRAQHPTLKRAVAIKVLPDHSSKNDEAYKRFMREAQTIAGLKHPNIINLYDVGEHDGRPFMVMEYIDGQDLSEVIKDRQRLPLSEALPILSDIAAALDHAHSSGIIHRDIKPSNVMIEKTTSQRRTSEGVPPLLAGEVAEGRRGSKVSPRAILMDFGIAKGYTAATRLTASGMIGTLDYISPEQIQGAAEVDARADIYSFGVMAYETLTGELPFKHTNPGAMVMAHIMQPPPDPREIVPDLSEEAALAVMKAMSKKPAERFNTAGEMIHMMG